MEYHIKEEDWAIIYQSLREEKGLHTKAEEKLRVFCEGIWYICRTGCQWRLLPSCYGGWRSIHRRFFRWAQQNIWGRLLEKAQIAPDLEAVMIDATIIRAHACAAGYEKDSQKEQALGHCVGGFTSKINALVDALGNPLRFILSPGQQHDIKAGVPLIEGVKGADVLADKGYDDDKLIGAIKSQGCRAVIPPRKNRKEPRGQEAMIRIFIKSGTLLNVFFEKSNTSGGSSLGSTKQHKLIWPF